MIGPVRNTARHGYLPGRAAVFARRRLSELVGLILLVAGAALLIALVTYDAGDPSLNTSVQHAPTNVMGRPGAIVSDLLVQSIGLAGLLLALTLAVWGWRLLRHRFSGRLWVRLLGLPLALLFAAVALVDLSRLVSSPFASGWGGATGEILHRDIAGILPSGLVADWAVSATAAGLAVTALLAALGLSAGDWRGVFSGVHRAGAAGARAGRQGGRIGVAAGGYLFRAWGRRRHGGGTVRPSPRGPRPRESGGAERREPTLGSLRSADRRVVDTKPKPPATAKADVRGRQGTLDLAQRGHYQLPPLDELDPPPAGAHGRTVDEHALNENARLLESVLEDFGVRGEIVKVRPGPVVTLYELEPAPGTKSSRVIGLADDIARSMSAVSVRVAVIPGRNVIGIELPNATREIVYLRELLSSDAYIRTSAHLTLALGKDIGGSPVIADLSRMPHLLIAGTTGSGKSVAINTMILSMLYRLPPAHCRFIMIDPKMLELSVYDGIPHLLAPVVTDPSKAVVALRWVVREMENRYRAMSHLGVRNIAGYNARLAEARRKGETLTRTVQTGFDRDTGEPIYENQPLDLEPLPFVVVVVDEMADLMLVAGKEVEAAVQRLAQMARAAGVHLIMATQRPSVDVITGTIKANFPTRVSFQVTSKIDSRTILGEAGAEQLLGQGDMLYMAAGGRITRVHGPLVTDDEVERVVRVLRDQGEPEYVEEVTDEDAQAGMPPLGILGGGGNGGDGLYDQAVALVCRERKASTSFIQRHLQIGYNRAARIIERMEAEGVVSGANHVGKREVLARDIGDRET